MPETPMTIDEEYENTDDNEVQEDIDSIGEESEERFYSQESTEFSELMAQASEEFAQVDVQLEVTNDIELQDLRYQGTESSESLSDSGGSEDAEYDDISSLSEEQHRGAGEARRKGRFFTRFKFISWVAGTLVSQLSLAFLIFKYANDKDNEVPETMQDQLTPEQIEAIRRRAELWRDLPDDQFWDALADFCKNWSPSWQAQLLILTYIKAWSKPAQWSWTKADKLAQINQLIETYGDSDPKSCSVIYRKAKTLTFDGNQDGRPEKLPRLIAADVVDLAISDIMHLEQIKNQSATSSLTKVA